LSWRERERCLRGRGCKGVGRMGAAAQQLLLTGRQHAAGLGSDKGKVSGGLALRL
jgi:hypothetical protein